MPLRAYPLLPPVVLLRIEERPARPDHPPLNRPPVIGEKEGQLPGIRPVHLCRETTARASGLAYCPVGG